MHIQCTLNSVWQCSHLMRIHSMHIRCASSQSTSRGGLQPNRNRIANELRMQIAEIMCQWHVKACGRRKDHLCYMESLAKAGWKLWHWEQDVASSPPSASGCKTSLWWKVGAFSPLANTQQVRWMSWEHRKLHQSWVEPVTFVNGLWLAHCNLSCKGHHCSFYEGYCCPTHKGAILKLTTRGKSFWKNFISSRMELKKVHKQDRVRKPQEPYPTT